MNIKDNLSIDLLCCIFQVDFNINKVCFYTIIILFPDVKHMFSFVQVLYMSFDII
jgi:hypothetical protein